MCVVLCVLFGYLINYFSTACLQHKPSASDILLFSIIQVYGLVSLYYLKYTDKPGTFQIFISD